MMKHIFGILILLLSFGAAAAQEVPVLDASKLHAGDPFGINISLTADEGRSFSGSGTEIHAEICPADDPESCQTMELSASGGESDTQQLRIAVDALPAAGDYDLFIRYEDPTGQFGTIRSQYRITGVLESRTPAEPAPADLPPIILTPAFLKTDPASGIRQYTYFGEQMLTGVPYTFALQSDQPLGEDTRLRVFLPEEFARENLSEASSCLDYYTPDGSMLIPGPALSDFSCGFIFTQPLALYNQMMHFIAEGEPQRTTSLTDWYNFPMTVTRQALSHQLTLSDSRGNLLCSDAVPCGMLNADDVFTLTYHYPSDWVASPLGSAPADAVGSVRVSLPDDWRSAIEKAQANGLMNGLDDPCSIAPDGTLDLTPQYSAGQERYTVSCRFALDGADPAYGAMQLHHENPYYQMADLNLQLPYALQKSQISLTPSLTLRMNAFDEGTGQISGGAVNRLYRAADDTGSSVRYTLKAAVSGISAARSPESGDRIRVSWSLLDQLAAAGALPSCLTPDGTGAYTLGTLEKNDGNWEASCEFAFPASLSSYTQSDAISLTLDSKRYQTSASVWVAQQPFAKEVLYADLDVPARFYLNFPQEIRARISGADGTLSAYDRELLQSHPVSLNNSWELNHATDCYGTLSFDNEGNAVCGVRFTAPAEASAAYFTLNSDLGDLAEIVLRSPAEYSFPAVTPVQAQLTAALYHEGTPEALPAADDAAYVVLDSYQLKFRLVPGAGFEDIAAAAQTDGSGNVTEWGAPLMLRWGLLNGGYEPLAFRRDGNEFEASYDFRFEQGDQVLSDFYRDISLSLDIPGWEITYPDTVRMPSAIKRQQAKLSIGEFSGPVRVGEQIRFDVRIDGNTDRFDPYALHVGIDEYGMQTPVTCSYDGFGTASCGFTAACTDLQGSYESACSSGLKIYAEYDGDPLNEPAAAEAKDFTVSREQLGFGIPMFGNLAKEDMVSIRAASEDMMYMDYGSLNADGIRIDSFLPAKVLGTSGWDYRSYPFTFSYSVDGDAQPDAERFILDIRVRKGTDTEDSVISLHASSVTYGEVRFDLDFGGTGYTADGQILRDALADVTSIEKVTVRYEGDTLIAAASRDFEAEGLTFALKVASVMSLELTSLTEHQMQFGGSFGSEALLQSYTVYCSQLAAPLHCYTEEPVFPNFTDEDQDGIDDWTGEPIPEVSPLPEDGCWGKIRTDRTVAPTVYVSTFANPQCYLTAIRDNGVIIATNVN